MKQVLRSVLRRLYREAYPLLHGRSQYKLFVERSIEVLDRRTRATLLATNVLSGFVRPIPISAPFGRSMLVVAPHHDDEIIGCGGAMLLQRRAGGGLHVVFTQDGGDEHAQDGRTREQQVAIRENEARRVAQDIGIEPPTFLRGVHLTGAEGASVAASLKSMIAERSVDVIFTPFFLDYNRHHQLTNFALAEALREVGRPVRVIGYEVWGLAIPNVIVRTDDVHDEKCRLLAHYASQLTGKDYIRATTGLAMFHSLHFGAGECKFAERYFEAPAAEFVRVVDLLQKEIRDANGNGGAAF